jgi:hypothetical protein
MTSSSARSLPPKATRSPIRKWLWRIGVILVLLLAAGAGVVVYLYVSANRTPDWFTRARLTGEARLAAIASVERKLGNFQGSLGEAVARQRSRPAPTVGDTPTDEPDRIATLELTGPELSTYFDKWLSDNGYDRAFASHLANPRLGVVGDVIAVAGEMPRFNDGVVSLHFRPTVGEEGRVRLGLDGAYLGRLNLPDSAFDVFRDQISGALRSDLPALHEEAGFDERFRPNDAAVSLAINRDLLGLVERRAIDDLVLFPELLDYGRVPVRVVDMTVGDDKVVLRLAPLDREERRALAADLRELPLPGEPAEAVIE